MSDDDDDEGGATPTKFEFSVESKLDEDHVFFLQFTNNFISNVTRPRDFDHCTRWLERLAGEPMYGIDAKRNRNMYLAKLLIAMMDNKVAGPFITFPPAGPLPSAALAFGLVPEDEMEESYDLALDWPDRELNMTEYRFKSTDGRTYVSTCALPNNTGAMGYVGITTGGGEGLWLNRDGERMCLSDVMGGDTIDTITPKTSLKEQIELVTSYKMKSKFEIDEPPPFKYLIRLPESSLSTSNLVEVKTRPCSPTSCKILREQYPEELVCTLEKMLQKNKAETDRILRNRHTKIVEQLYREYEQEVERGLKEYKIARMEWQEVMDVVQGLHLIEDEIEQADTDVAGSNDDVLKILSESYNQAVKRSKIVYKEGQELDKKIEEAHKVIHDRAIVHKHELAIMEKHVSKMITDIDKLKIESRRKQQVIQALLSEIKDKN